MAKWFFKSADVKVAKLLDDNCKGRNSLRWYGGSNSSWQDLICTACHSMYEVKSKATMEKVESTFKYNKISAGSFERFCSLYNSPKNPNQKMFLVVLPRSDTLNRRREVVHPVYVAEIDTAKPKLCESSFNNKRTSMSLKTNVSLKLHTKARWFDLPPPEFVDIGSIKEKVYRHVWKEMLGSPRGKFFCTGRGPHRRILCRRESK